MCIHTTLSLSFGALQLVMDKVSFASEKSSVAMAATALHPVVSWTSAVDFFKMPFD